MGLKRFYFKGCGRATYHSPQDMHIFIPGPAQCCGTVARPGSPLPGLYRLSVLSAEALHFGKQTGAQDPEAGNDGGAPGEDPRDGLEGRRPNIPVGDHRIDRLPGLGPEFGLEVFQAAEII